MLGVPEADLAGPAGVGELAATSGLPRPPSDGWFRRSFNLADRASSRDGSADALVIIEDRLCHRVSPSPGSCCEKLIRRIRSAEARREGMTGSAAHQAHWKPPLEA